MNLNLLLEQVLFENDLVLIAEQAQVIGQKLEKITDFAELANKQAETAKAVTKKTGQPINPKDLLDLRSKLMNIVSVGQNWQKTLTPEQREKKLDDYIQNAYVDPSSVVGLGGEILSPGLNLKGLRYLHRRFIKGF